METRAALADVDVKFAHFSAIGGLGGADISLDMMLGTIRKLNEVKNEPGLKETQWYMVD